MTIPPGLIHGAVARGMRGLKKLPIATQMAMMTGVSEPTAQAVEAFGMGATEPLKGVTRGIEAFARIPKGVGSLDELIESGRFYNPKMRFWSSKDLAEQFGDVDAATKLGLRPDELETARVMIDSDLSHFGMRDAPMHAQPDVLRDMARQYDVPDRASMHDLDKAVRGSINDGASEFLPGVDRNMLAKRRYSNAGVHGLVDAYTHNGKEEAAFNVFDPRRVKILERLAAMGLSGAAIKELMQKIRSDQRTQAVAPSQEQR